VSPQRPLIYDPRNSLLKAYRNLFAQWCIAFEIGAQNRQRCAGSTPLSTLAKLILEFNRGPKLTVAKCSGS
jgi:hypothetical protein